MTTSTQSNGRPKTSPPVNSMDIEKVANFLRGLKTRTLKKEIAWYQDDDRQAFSANVKAAKVTLMCLEDENPFGEPDYAVTFRRASDDTFIISYNDSQLKDALPGAFHFMEELYKVIRMQVLGLDDILYDALDEYDDENDIPF